MILDKDLEKILEEKCDLRVLKRDNITSNDLRHWKLAGIIDVHTDKVYLNFGDSTECRLILESGNTMWADNFKVAIISSNYYKEIIILINPGELDMYSITNYDDIISIINTEFIPEFIEKNKQTLYKLVYDNGCLGSDRILCDSPDFTKYSSTLSTFPTSINIGGDYLTSSSNYSDIT